MMRLRCIWAVLGAISAMAAEPILKPRHDPPDQPFRRAPMAESARSVLVNLATNLHYAFDTDLLRVHTVWQGGPLNLWGPPYSYAKTPFICNFDGQVLFSFPGFSPWGELSARYRSVEVTNGAVAFAYEVGSERDRVIESWRGATEATGWRLERKLRFPNGTARPRSYVAFAEAGARAAKDGNALRLTGTNGLCILTAEMQGVPIPASYREEQVSYDTLRITEEGTEKGLVAVRFTGLETRVSVGIPARPESFEVVISLSRGTGPVLSAPAHGDRVRSFGAGSERLANSGDPYYRIEHFPLPPEAELLITGMDWMPNGDLAVCTWLGEIYVVEHAAGETSKATYKRFASGLNEPLGLAVNQGEIFVVQKGELTRVSDTDHDGVADRFECINSSWGYSGNYHSYSFGPLITDDRNFLVFVTGQRGLYDLPYQGWALEIAHDGDRVSPFCSGLRVPHGWGFYGPARDIFVTDNQGNWIGACRLNHLQRDRFYGFPSSTPASRASPRAEDVEPPVLWFPRALSPSASGFDSIADDRFGPFRGQLLIGDFQNSIVMRACLEKVAGRWQGAVFPFAKGFLSGVNRLSMGPDAKLYVGGGKRTWSTAAPREASLDRVAFTGKLPFEVQEVQATASGFELRFTKPLEKEAASDPANYLVKQFTYQYHQEYGSPEFDHRGQVGATELPVQSARLLNDTTVSLVIPELRTGFVTSCQIAVSSREDEELRNETFYYTLNHRPAAAQ